MVIWDDLCGCSFDCLYILNRSILSRVKMTCIHRPESLQARPRFTAPKFYFCVVFCTSRSKLPKLSPVYRYQMYFNYLVFAS